MCTGVEAAWLYGAATAASVGSAVHTADQSRKSANEQRESLLRAESERKNAEAQAAQKAALLSTERRRAARTQSLLTGASSTVNSNQALGTSGGYGKSLLGS
jgi:regulator of protease activity HflC (stomatin/prohibitin superfamily)